jgi:hypothetical protein
MNRLRARNWVGLGPWKARKLVLCLMMTVCTLLLVEAIQALTGKGAEPLILGSPSVGYHTVSAGSDVIADAHPLQAAFKTGQDPGRSYSLTAGELVSVVVANELTDREQLRKWICMIEKRTGKRALTQLQVETKDGPVYRLLSVDGAPLDVRQRNQDDARIGQLMKDPRPLQKLKQAQADDELKLQRLISLMPRAFVYEYDGGEESLLRVKFRPNPDYDPPNYEARIVHSLAGTVLIDTQHKRLAKVAGHLVTRVEFGYGLLGRIDSGTLELERVEVGPQLWKTTFINMHFSGRVALFKTINKDQYERRSDFQVVSSELSLSEARDLLISRVPASPEILSTHK